MDYLRQILRDFWFLSEEMAPYLLLGFFIAALLRLVVDETFVRSHLGNKGWRQTVKAAVLGVPLPLCSCGVIPVAASLRRQGGSAGAVTSFTASTPQTGVDSIFATAALLNWPFALIRVVVAFINGVLAGSLVDRFADQKPAKGDLEVSSASCCGGDMADSVASPTTFQPTTGRFDFAAAPTAQGTGTPFTPLASTKAASCCAAPQPASASSCCSAPAERASRSARAQDAFRFGFLTLPADIGKALIFGLFLAALLGVALPDDLASSTWTTGILAYLATTLVAVPIYVCSTGSIPMAYALIGAGFSPGAALVFLIAGPATNTATISALWKMIGPRAVVIYVTTLIAVAWVAGFLLDQSGMTMQFADHHAHEAGRVWWKLGSAVLLYAILGYAFWQPFRRRREASA